MKAWHHRVVMMGAMVSAMAIGQGCTSHTIDYTVDSGTDGYGMSDDAYAMDSAPASSGAEVLEQNRTWASDHGGTSYGQDRTGESYGFGVVESPRARSLGEVDSSNNYASYGSDNGTYNSANYGHDYDGVPGYRSDHGPVTGFSNGSADTMELEPEAWAEAYLRGSLNGDHAAADGDARTSGGLVPEYIGQDSFAGDSNYSDYSDYPDYSNYSNQAMNHASNGHQASSPVSSQAGSFENYVSNRNARNASSLDDVYFAFDSWEISQDNAYVLESGAEWLLANPGSFVTIEGHCDERGTSDYNMVLGQKRALAAKGYLADLGVDPSRMKVVSYGKERPFCFGQTESCYQQNRRGHMAVRPN